MSETENKTKKITEKSRSDQERQEDTTGKTVREADTDIISKIIGFLMVFGLLFYFFVWKSLSWDPKYKLILMGLIVIAIIFIYIFFKAKTERFFKVLSNSIVVVLIVFGATIASIFFTFQSQTWLFKIFTILYFSLLPPWLYLQFVSTKGRTLWDEYVCNLFRLRVDRYTNLPKPPERSIFYKEWRRAHDLEDSPDLVEEKKSIYKKKFEGLFGPVISDESIPFAVFRGENLWPVAFATLIVSVGWVLVVGPETIFGISLLNANSQSSGSPTIPLDTFRFAFIGAYFYILQMLVRRYFQNDLKTSAYVNSIMRIIVVILLVWVIDLAWEQGLQEQKMIFAFIIGVFPYVGWQALQALMKMPIKLVVPSLRQQYPLSDLDGLNIWYESRLLEEGIEDMQNLVTANLVDVMLNTRIPVERLIDWVDQSMLYLHLGTHNNKGKESNRTKLRNFGIRTATDLEDAFEYSNDNGKAHIGKLEYILNTNKDEPSILRSILSTLKNEPNYYHVKQWKSFPMKKLDTGE